MESAGEKLLERSFPPPSLLGYPLSRTLEKDGALYMKMKFAPGKFLPKPFA
jgi:hypothetical protein